MSIKKQRFKLSSLLKQVTEPSELTLNLPLIRAKKGAIESPARANRVIRSPSQNNTPPHNQRLTNSSNVLEYLLGKPDSTQTQKIKACQNFLKQLSLNESSRASSLLLSVWQIYEEELYFKDYKYGDVQPQLPFFKQALCSEVANRLIELRSEEFALQTSIRLNQQKNTELLNQRVEQARAEERKATELKMESERQLAEMRQQVRLLNEEVRILKEDAARQNEDRKQRQKEMKKVFGQLRALKETNEAQQRELKVLKTENRQFKVNVTDSKYQKLMVSRELVLEQERDFRDSFLSVRLWFKALGNRFQDLGSRLRQQQQRLRSVEEDRSRQKPGKRGGKKQSSAAEEVGPQPEPDREWWEEGEGRLKSFQEKIQFLFRQVKTV